ncbi:MAG: site-specific integrase [Anaerolineales bacterium]|nr:site-specific integrase [Anaerolineales bacterium]MBX3006012.1 site-specific integrase [Anaerolineales bacterium]
MAKRRNNQEGAIYQKPNGRWQAQFSIEGRRFSKSFPSKRECVDWLREMANQKDRGLTSKGVDLTFHEFFERWLLLTKPRVRPKTWLQYRGIGSYHLMPKFGKTKLVDIKPAAIQDLYAEKLRDGLGARTVQLIHGVLRSSLGFAERQGLISYSPTKRVDKPTFMQPEMKFLSDVQVKALLALTEGSSLGTLLQMAVTTGMRQGELLGLRWADVDWASATVRVRRQLQRIPYQGLIFTEPKSRNGIRTVQLGSLTLRALMQHKERQGAEFLNGENTEDLLFPSSTGTPKEPRILYAQFKKALKMARVPDVRFHDLRHTAASLMLMSGMELIRIARQLGHSKPSITLDIYGHLIPGLENASAERLDELVAPLTAADLQQQAQKSVFKA